MPGNRDHTGAPSPSVAALRTGVLHAPVRAFELHQVPVVDDAVDRRTGEFSVSEDAAPLAELQVGGKDDAVVLIATR